MIDGETLDQKIALRQAGVQLHLGRAPRVVRGVEQSLEAVRVGGAVVVQEPHPRDGIGGERLVGARSEVRQAGPHGLAEADGRGLAIRVKGMPADLRVQGSNRASAWRMPAESRR